MDNLLRAVTVTGIRSVLACIMALGAMAMLPLGTMSAATLTLPAIFGDHMVLQRDGDAPVWGNANPGEVITVTAGGVIGAVTADAAGKWLVRLKNLPVSDTPITMKIQGATTTITYSDVLVGDVWLASGQSNMEKSFSTDSQYATEKLKATNTLVRQFLCPRQILSRPTTAIPVDSTHGFWRVCSPTTVGSISAVGYYFARDIAAYTNHPVGLIDSSVGGSSTQSWTSLQALSAVPDFSAYAAEGLALYNRFSYPYGVQWGDISACFNGKINPYIPYGLKGVVWYQGESNSNTPAQIAEYRLLLPTMIQDWRTRWGQGDFPFILLQLPKPCGSPDMSQSQTCVASMPHNGLAVAYDIGAPYSLCRQIEASGLDLPGAKDPMGLLTQRLHPTYKHGPGLRLALAARKVAYGDGVVVSSGPSCTAVTIEGNRGRVHFDHVGSGLKIGVPPADWNPRETRVSTSTLLGFQIAGADGVYQTATATIDGNAVLVSSASVPNPTLVRYGYTDLEYGKNNLYNNEGLPAVPFRSDELFAVNGGPARTGVPQTITFGALPSKILGDAQFTLMATAFSGLPISYTSSNTAVATISGATVTIVGVGSTAITASQAGNATYHPASSVQRTLTVNPAGSKLNQTITFGALASKTVGDAAFALTATASSGLAVSYTSSNTAVATIAGSTVTIVGAGASTITASQAGNATYHPASSVQQTLTVNAASKLNQTITFGALTAKTVGDAPFALTATASSGLVVGYASSNTAVATIAGTTVTIVGVGSTTITASQAGNATYHPASSVQQTLTVNPASKLNQTITFGALTAKAVGDAPFALTATASSGLVVGYASSNTAVATIAGTTVTIVGVGSTTITASQAGNATYHPASSVQQTLTVNAASKLNQTITFGALTAKAVSDAPFTLTATASSGLAVGYASSNTAVATIAGTTVTIVGVGSTTITASQAGNANYHPAGDVAQSLVVNKAAQSITFAVLAGKTYGDASFDLTATASSGLAVSYTSSNTAVATISDATVTIVGVGSTTITASQAGNARYQAASPVMQSLIVAKAAQTIAFTVIGDQVLGVGPIALTATASSGLPVAFSVVSGPGAISDSSLTLTGAGSLTVAADQEGDAHYQTAPQILQVITVASAPETSDPPSGSGGGCGVGSGMASFAGMFFLMVNVWLRDRRRPRS